MRFAESSGDNLLLLSCPAPFSRALGRRIAKVYSGRGGPALLWNHLTGAFRCGFHMDAIAVNRALAVLCGHFASELGELLFRIREILLIELQAWFEQWNVRGRGCLSPADLVGIHLYGRWDDFGRIVPKTDR